MGNLQTFSSHFSKRTNIVGAKRSTVFLLFTESVQVPIHKEGVCCQLIRPAFGNFFPLAEIGACLFAAVSTSAYTAKKEQLK